ncbi:imidazole glycerol phosphate synthase subunit HisH [Mesoterricola silvestris]|uniref:Imidazole glycerol phosphate synthase subunit HisH n=1 Tax=Mesoterricola silvestris TaxID=2927979 RepID=A0AA48GPP5_9BACT|nr:imidazole glycerol phosphate synthase subunit HisH [Mesoterricola silvestris]BDU71717.1 imidazole glycerol phosphate synthase subunit HisH [Mesoterricola silvestris]
MIGIVDYGCGNLRSLENALEFLGLESRRVSAREDVLAMDRLILPGVGNFGHAGAELARRGLGASLRERAGLGRPLLGICLGMQLLFEGSEEAPETEGLGLLPGRSELFADPALKVPHMGWSAVEFGELSGAAYFVHSYFLPGLSGDRPAQVATARYGRPFLAGFRSGSLAGFQFHPEKSGAYGLNLLKEALAWS